MLLHFLGVLVGLAGWLLPNPFLFDVAGLYCVGLSIYVFLVGQLRLPPALPLLLFFVLWLLLSDFFTALFAAAILITAVEGAWSFVLVLRNDALRAPPEPGEFAANLYENPTLTERSGKAPAKKKTTR